MENINNAEIKIFISCHHDCNVVDDPIFIPVQTGAALAEERFEYMMQDDTGENISELNREYCELTGQYWAWKNQRADYYGFCHYRRYFSFNPVPKEKEHWIDEKGLQIYDPLYSSINKKTIQEGFLSGEYIKNTVKQYDVILPYPDNSDMSVYEHYKNAKSHRVEDMDAVIDIIMRDHPDFIDAMKEYLNCKKHFFCNMFIMRKEIFDEYSGWLFDILEKLRNERSRHDYSMEENRAIGFIGERLLGIYFTWIKKNKKNINVGFLARMFFKNVDKTSYSLTNFDRHSIPIVLATDDAYMPQAAALISSVIKHASQNTMLDFIILTRGIQSRNRTMLLRSFERCGNVNIQFVNMMPFVDGHSDSALPVNYPLEVTYRLFAAEILSNYEKIVYLDCDTIVCSDIEELYSADLVSKPYAMAVDLDYTAHYIVDDEFRKATLKDFTKDEIIGKYGQSGVMVINTKEFKSRFKSSELMSLMIAKQFRFPDQDLLNYIIRGKNLIHHLPLKWNVQVDFVFPDGETRKGKFLSKVPSELYAEYIDAEKSPKIIHFCIPHELRPWNHPFVLFGDRYWDALRSTYFYEGMIGLYAENMARKIAMSQMTIESDLLNATLLSDGKLKLPGLASPIYVNGNYVKAIKKIEQMFPLGSRRRSVLKFFAKHFLR